MRSRLFARGLSGLRELAAEPARRSESAANEIHGVSAATIWGGNMTRSITTEGVFTVADPRSISPLSEVLSIDDLRPRSGEIAEPLMDKTAVVRWYTPGAPQPQVHAHHADASGHRLTLQGLETLGLTAGDGPEDGR
jgi:hypothetical protein